MPLHLPKEQRKTAVTAGIIGNVMEWYDFALYGFTASILSKLFFPSGSHVASLLATYGIFAVGFIMRPIGSALFGWLGDSLGRTKTMMISVIMMTFPTFVLGCLPTFSMVGFWAPVSLVLVRLIQGLSVGGEFSSSVTYLVETAPKGTRGLSGSWANVGSMGGMLLGSGAASLVISLFDDQTLYAWGWRIPFLVAAIFGAIAILLRRHLPRSKHFQDHVNKRQESSPIKEAITTNIKETLQALIFASAYGAIFYISLIYIPTWIKEFIGSSSKTATQFNTLTIMLITLMIPFTGLLSDKLIRRRRLLAIVFASELIIAVPLFLWMSSGEIASVIVSQVFLGILIAFPCGVAPSLFVELFPTRDRLSGYSIAFNIGIGVVGGSTPMVSTWLIKASGMSIAPAFYMTGWAIIAVIVLLCMKDRSREPLK